MVADPPPAVPAFRWHELHWPQPLDPERAVAVLRSWAAEQRSPRLVLEVRAEADRPVRYLLGGPVSGVRTALERLTTAVPDARATALRDDRQPVMTVRRLKLSTRHRPLRLDDPAAVARGVLGVMTGMRKRERLVLQIVLGPRRIPLAVPTNSPASIVQPWPQVAWHGNGRIIDSEKRSALRTKVGDHGFAVDVRLGVIASSPERRRELLLHLFAALRVSEAPGVQMRLSWAPVSGFNSGQAPWRWPLRLNSSEVLILSGWPLGDEPLPGLPALHPKRLPPAPGTTGSKRVVAESAAPGLDVRLCLPPKAALHHTHLLGPTGTGKSTLMINLITQDMADGHAVVVVDPQGDLIADCLARVPEHRRADVAVLDPSDAEAPVGLNPLLTRGRNPEVVADTLLGIFRQLYGESLGPRSQDILHACLLTLTRRPGASLVMLPLLLTNTHFRRQFTSDLRDPVALGPFWDWYEHLSEAERQSAIAPIQNKLRQWLLRPSLRNVLGQSQPKLSMSEVFRERKILFVSLAQGQLGPEGAALIGSLVVAELWQATTERSGIPTSRRRPVMVYLDEFSAFLNLPTDLADALARSRGMAVGYTLAHQFMSQLSPTMRAAVMANTRSRVCFQLAADDAGLMARSHPELSAEDFTALGRYEIYASLFADGQVTAYASGRTLPPPAAISAADELRLLSRHRYGQPVRELEREVAALIAGEPSPGTDAGEPELAPGRSRRRRA